ncbi:putative glutathion S-transferase II, GST-II [Corynespora cassiicola Philippines]|uniref:glutathione transferase n=1 Tax=Corynespora cassiicola Philippines TaxID=1448308 RepID=A0A2T2N846_CORCC|nr:putative glutathion S-transferase II, GST-II [Corynespora cassiicola Philippines]
MSLKLIGLKQSICTSRPLLVLAEKGVTDFELKPVDFAAGEHKSAAHLALQPFGQIPVLDDNGFLLYESRPIARYLAKKFSDRGPALIPANGDDKAWARFEQWASVEVNNFDAPAQQIYLQKRVMPMRGQPIDEKIVAFYRQILADKFDAFDRILSKQPYMGGVTFSLIDIFYMPLMNALFGMEEGRLITERLHLKAWWDRVSSRESWQNLYK